jgi:hypothetical protein
VDGREVFKAGGVAQAVHRHALDQLGEEAQAPGLPAQGMHETGTEYKAYQLYESIARGEGGNLDVLLIFLPIRAVEAGWYVECQ